MITSRTDLLEVCKRLADVLTPAGYRKSPATVTDTTRDAAIRVAALKEAALIAEGEFLVDYTGNLEDAAYDQAISDVALAIRAAKGRPA